MLQHHSINLSREQILEFVKTFMFMLEEYEPPAPPILVLNYQGPHDRYTINIKLKDLFKARQWLLGISRDNKKLKEHFYPWWAKHIEWLGGKDDS